MNKWMHGLMDKWKDGWMDGLTIIHDFYFLLRLIKLRLQIYQLVKFLHHQTRM